MPIWLYALYTKRYQAKKTDPSKNRSTASLSQSAYLTYFGSSYGKMNCYQYQQPIIVTFLAALMAIYLHLNIGKANVSLKEKLCVRYCLVFILVG
jgi:hypothetical protein